MNVATFGPASLQAQLAELKRERTKRDSVYPVQVAKGRLSQHAADFQNRGLDAAIKTLERIVTAELRGEPGRKELVETLSALAKYARTMAHGEGAPIERLDKPIRDAFAILEKVGA